jgi:hypothetical protein
VFRQVRIRTALRRIALFCTKILRDRRINRRKNRGFEPLPIRIIDPIRLTPIPCEGITLKHNKHAEIRLHPLTCMEAELRIVLSLSQAGVQWFSQKHFGP